MSPPPPVVMFEMMSMGIIEELGRALMLPLAFLLIPFILLKIKGYNFTKSLNYIYIDKKDFYYFQRIVDVFRESFLLLLAMLVITFIESLILFELGLFDLEKVEVLIAKQPLYILWIAVLLSPVAEEIFFRGLLQRRFGWLPAAIVFGLSHALYGSVAELIGAFTLGLVLGYYVLKKKNLLPVIFAHTFYNVFSILSFIG